VPVHIAPVTEAWVEGVACPGTHALETLFLLIVIVVVKKFYSVAEFDTTT